MTIVGDVISSTLASSYASTTDLSDMFENNSNATDFLDESETVRDEYLIQATRIIDSLPLRGNRVENEYIYNGSQKDTNLDGIAQTLEFPRYVDGVCCDYDFGTGLSIVPQRVKDACCIIAFNLYKNSDESGSSQTIDEVELQKRGITGFTLGKLSMTFGGAGSADSYCGFYGLTRDSYNLLRRYIETTPYVM